MNNMKKKKVSKRGNIKNNGEKKSKKKREIEWLSKTK